jgi:hypothetical protein
MADLFCGWQPVMTKRHLSEVIQLAAVAGVHSNAAVDDPFAAMQQPVLSRTAVKRRSAAANILSFLWPKHFITTDVGRCSNIVVELAPH